MLTSCGTEHWLCRDWTALKLSVKIHVHLNCAQTVDDPVVAAADPCAFASPERMKRPCFLPSIPFARALESADCTPRSSCLPSGGPNTLHIASLDLTERQQGWARLKAAVLEIGARLFLCPVIRWLYRVNGRRAGIVDAHGRIVPGTGA